MRGGRWAGACATLFVMGLSACDLLYEVHPPNAVRVIPPSHYLMWWQQVEACSGLSGNIERVRWWVEPGVNTVTGRGGAAGVYYEERHTIVLAGDWADHGPIVRHEMLHALSPTAGHPRELFRDRCGDVVSCSAGCAEEAGSPPVRGPEVARVPLDSLHITLEMVPATPATSLMNGHLMLVVFATNPFNHAIVVEFPDLGGVGGPRGFGYSLRGHPHGGGLSYNGFQYDAGVAYFQAGETKRGVFDFHLATERLRGMFEAGNYRARGLFDVHYSRDTLFFSIAP
jgi:hypothetical protein